MYAYTLFLLPGVIYTTTKLDREHQSRYYLDVQASIKGAPDSMSSPAQLVVIVTDVNDNDPKFIKKNFQVMSCRLFRLTCTYISYQS